MLLEQASKINRHMKSLKVVISYSSLFLFLAAIFVYFSLASPHFLKPRNFINIFTSVSVIGIISTAMTLALIGRGPDLTVGAIVAMMGSIQTYLVLIKGFPWYVGMLAGVAIGVGVGLINGLIIVKFDLSPFIVTLGMMNVVRGFCFVLTDGLAHFINIPGLVYLGRATWAGIPVSIVVLLASFIIFDFVSKKTVFGRQLYASGSNRTAARLAGINTDRIGISLYVISGLMAAIAGIVLVGIGGAAIPNIGESYPMDAITAVLLGGTSLAGGAGSVRKTFLGILIIGVLNNGMALLNVQTFWQISAKGLLLLMAVITDGLRNRHKN
ncbi:MAG: ABC transporter permease [Christensenellales bacterium]|jgi:ribose/xylose/arabinose/galactoside ABC-type transport system permease subunit